MQREGRSEGESNTKKRDTSDRGTRAACLSMHQRTHMSTTQQPGAKTTTTEHLLQVLQRQLSHTLSSASKNLFPTHRRGITLLTTLHLPPTHTHTHTPIHFPIYTSALIDRPSLQNTQASEAFLWMGSPGPRFRYECMGNSDGVHFSECAWTHREKEERAPGVCVCVCSARALPVQDAAMAGSRTAHAGCVCVFLPCPLFFFSCGLLSVGEMCWRVWGVGEVHPCLSVSTWRIYMYVYTHTNASYSHVCTFSSS